MITCEINVRIRNLIPDSVKSMDGGEMRHLIHLIDGRKFTFIPDLEEIGHYEIDDPKDKKKKETIE